MVWWNVHRVVYVTWQMMIYWEDCLLYLLKCLIIRYTYTCNLFKITKCFWIVLKRLFRENALKKEKKQLFKLIKIKLYILFISGFGVAFSFYSCPCFFNVSTKKQHELYYLVLIIFLVLMKYHIK